MAANLQPIIIKRKGSHGGHHGGAWKVAYADFVTAMMALFIVLWLMNTSKPIQQAISGYFKDPAGTGKLTGTNQAPGPENSKASLDKVKAELEKAIRQVANFDKLKDHIELTVTPEGLRIEMLESKTGTFFESGQTDPNGDGREMMMTIGEELGKVPNKVSIEGHTDSQPFAARAN
jgi:chemotaxis protein MotB